MNKFELISVDLVNEYNKIVTNINNQADLIKAEHSSHSDYLAAIDTYYKYRDQFIAFLNEHPMLRSFSDDADSGNEECGCCSLEHSAGLSRKESFYDRD